MIQTNALNETQLSAVETVNGPLLVLAGAGSGKTRVVTYRIAHLLSMGIAPHEILGVTFTNKAAEEMKERVRSLTNSTVLICTFHSLGVRILRESIHHLGYQNNFTIYDEEDSLKLLKVCLAELHLKDKSMEPKTFKRLISQSKNALKDPKSCLIDKATSELERVFPSVYALYQQRLQQCHALDFDDLLFLTVTLFKNFGDILENYQNRWRYLLVDEYQDTNQAQYRIVSNLVAKTGNLCVVGDPDQSIYSWRGANIQNILNFENDFPGAKVVRLDRNYRSRANILDAANALIGYNENRYEKRLWSDLGEGEKIKYFIGDTEHEEADFVAKTIEQLQAKYHLPLSDIAVFYRTNSQSRVFEDCFLSRRLPYVIVGGISFYQRREIKDILAFLRMVNSGTDFISFSRTINLPKRGIGNTTIEKIRIGASQEGISIEEYCEKLIDQFPLRFSTRLSSKQSAGLQKYLEMIRELKRIAQECSLKELVSAAITHSGYLKVLAADQETYDDRKGNLDELIAKAIEWEQAAESPGLGAFLEELSLKSNLDEMSSVKERINLMTIHNGKGLEFPAVFLVGMEEDLFPHANARGSHDALEEERRLCYVGITRAKELLYLTRSRMRYLWGTARSQRQSRFVKEIPSQYIEKIREVRAIHAKQQTNIASEAEFSPGDAVFHSQFGAGIIEGISQESVGMTYTVRFSRANEVKTLVARFAKLIKI